VPKSHSFFEKYCKGQVQDESALRKNYLDACYQETIVNIREEIGNPYIWVTVDGTTDALRRFVANLIIGKLDPEAPCRSFLTFSTVARFVNDGLKVLWPQSVQEEKVLVLYSDTAAYMPKAVTALKMFYQNVIHFSCMAHGLQHVAEEVRSNFPDINKLISLTKIFCESPTTCAMLQKPVA
jgi:hypothetical protein